jgi:cell wall-associated NlpC family hydrolase
MSRQTYFFEDAAAQQRLCNAAAEWPDTPFREFSKAPGRGGGVDCVGLCEALMAAAGVCEFSFPREQSDYQGHAPGKILRYLRGRIADDPRSARLAEIFAEIPLPAPQGPVLRGKGIPWNPPKELFMPGDLVICKSDGLFHMPIMLRGRRFISAVHTQGVIEGDIHDPSYSRHFVALFRARSDAGLATS